MTSAIVTLLDPFVCGESENLGIERLEAPLLSPEGRRAKRGGVVPRP
jgi:hypothetical protein